jgi:hypothetical protein
LEDGLDEDALAVGDDDDEFELEDELEVEVTGVVHAAQEHNTNYVLSK